MSEIHCSPDEPRPSTRAHDIDNPTGGVGAVVEGPVLEEVGGAVVAVVAVEVEVGLVTVVKVPSSIGGT
jgi:hypothetical protein